MLAGIGFLLFALNAAHADYTNVSSVLDGAGARSSAGSYSNISAVAQPGGVAVSSGGGLVNYAGFLNTFVLQPGLDTDGDGLADENDLDNDDDRLTDEQEIAGSEFAPTTPTKVNVADSDGDGIADGDEAVAETNPDDINANLKITSIEQVGADIDVTWIARQDKDYAVRGTDDSYEGSPSNLVGMSVGGPGAGAWQVTTNTLTDTGGALAGDRYYSVEALQ